jgi:NhaP-type Na+/H+ and K+/H+ antiporter
VEIPDDDGMACVNITHDLLSLWNVSEDEVFEIARKNAKYTYKSMQLVIADLMDIDAEELDLEKGDAMYVVTNASKNRGAAALFDFDFLRNVAEELESDFYILPSSLHEIILVLEQEAPAKELLKEMISDVNQTQVSEEEFLSDNVYFYCREENQVKIVEVN